MASRYLYFTGRLPLIQYTLRTRQRGLSRDIRCRTFVSTARKGSAFRSPIIEALHKHNPDSPAIVHALRSASFTYGSLIQNVAERQVHHREQSGQDLSDKSVALLVENGYDYVVSLLALLGSGARAIPLTPSLPASELAYIVGHCEASALVYSKRLEDFGHRVLSLEGLSRANNGARLSRVLIEDTVQRPAYAPSSHPSASTPAPSRGNPNNTEPENSANDLSTSGIMLYTSGTTARPKGVLLTQATLMAQARSLLQAWSYSPTDRLLHLLPLHHIHGVVNALIAPLVAGSSVEFMYPFNAEKVWERIGAPAMRTSASPFSGQSGTQNGVQAPPPITFLTAVPTIYTRLLQTHPQLSPTLQAATREMLRPQNLRLNISGSAALPVPTKEAWTTLSGGNVLLERYGMTEVGMALSCGLGMNERLGGSVGWPLPGVEARLVDIETGDIIPEPCENQTDVHEDGKGKEQQGEIQLRGPSIFRSYWQDHAATAKAFTPEGWFRTGDIAVRRPSPPISAPKSNANENEREGSPWIRGPAWYILGRSSTDILKIRGEKISALEIEREILGLGEVSECAVVGLTSGVVEGEQTVAAVVVLSAVGKEKGWGNLEMRSAIYGSGRLAVLKRPRVIRVVEGIRRNAMGKVNKKELVWEVFGEGRDAGSLQVEDAGKTA